MVIFLIVLAFLFSPIIGAVYFYYSSFIIYLVRRWIGGNALYKDVLCAFSWSQIPVLINLMMWLLLLIFSKDLIFSMNSLEEPGNIFVNFIFIISTIWSLVIIIQGVAEVQGFSILRSIGNLFLALLANVFIIAVIGIIVAVVFYLK